MVKITERLKEKYPKASIGVLVIRNVNNIKSNEELNIRKVEIEEYLREKFNGRDRAYLKSLENIKVYNDYYKKFKKTYHVLMQVESIAFKNKSIPSIDCLVQSMFMAEVKNQLLTAGHDADKINGKIKVDLSSGDEEYKSMSGKMQKLAENDMFMHDDCSIISSLIYGPDNKSKIDLNTKNVIYIVYAPEGIEENIIISHLEDIKDNVELFSKDAVIEELRVIK